MLPFVEELDLAGDMLHTAGKMEKRGTLDEAFGDNADGRQASACSVLT